VTEPILAVGLAGLTGEHWQQIVAALDPDLFIDMGLADDARAAARDQLGKGLTSWPDFTGEPPGFPWLWCHPLVVDGPAGDAPAPFPPDNLRALAGVGAVEDFLMWNVHGPGIQQPSDEQRRALTQLTRNTTAWLSARQVSEEALGSTAAPPLPAVIWVSEENSFTDAIGFWNARALVATASAVSHVAAILLPPDLPDWADLADLLALNVHAHYPRPHPDAFIFSHTIAQDQLRIIAGQLNLTEAAPAVGQAKAAPGSLGGQPDPAAAPTAAIGLDPTPWCCYPRRYGRGTSELMQVFSSPTVIRAPSPVPFRIGTGGWVQVSLSGLCAFAVPRRRAVAQLFRPDARYSAGRLCVTRPAANTFEVEVTIPEPPAVLAATLLDAGVTFTLSDKGKYAQALLDRAPGFPEMLLRPGTLEVITELTRKRTDRVQKDLETFLQDNSLESGVADHILALARQHLPIPNRQVSQLARPDLPAGEAAEIVEQLTAAGLCSRGLVIKCGTCQMESYIELGEVTRRATCPGCGAAGGYSADPNDPMGPVIRYRLSSLLDRASDNGAPPHLLGLACLRQHADDRPLYILPGALLHAGTQSLGEADLIGYLAEQIIIGEVKTSANWFTEAQVKKDLALAAQVRADVYVMVAVTAISEQQKTMAGALAAAQGCELLTFSGPEARLAAPGNE
jgi:hypothetical protein